MMTRMGAKLAARWSFSFGSLVGLPLAAQSQVADWRQVQPAVSRHAVAYDSVRGCTVLFGGAADGRLNEPELLQGDTWELDGSRWLRRDMATAPSPRIEHAMAFDLARGQVVLFGGRDGSNVLDDTWTYDGTAWTHLVIPAPPARSQHTLVHDVWRSRTVLFGGSSPASYLDDTWEFDGRAWIRFVGSVQPPARARHGASFDLSRGRTVVAGGLGIAAGLSDTWEFDGASWRSVSTPVPAPGGPLCATHHFAWASTLVLRGDQGPSGAELWAYDGADWRQLPSPGERRRDAAIGFDLRRGHCLLIGGVAGTGAIAEVLAFDGLAWSIAAPSPPPRWAAAMAFDLRRGRAVLFGGSGMSSAPTDTWELRDSTWNRVVTATAPPPRFHHALTYDVARGLVVLFGGYDASTWHPSWLDDTWEYDGVDWRRVTTTSSPPRRGLHGLTYDLVRDRSVLFGGVAAAGLLDDTWEYDGVDWRAATPAVSPPPGIGSALAYDSARDRTILFAGRCANPALTDTWEYDGTTWRPLAAFPANGCMGGALGGQLVNDVLRGRTVLWKGARGAVPEASTWQFDGVQWEPMTPPTLEPPFHSTAAFDPFGQRLVMFGGDMGAGPVGATWELALPALPTWTRYGIGCAGSAGVPGLTADASAAPALGSTFTLLLQDLPAQPGLALVAFGTDLVRWNGQPLPIALDPLGLPACRLFVAPEPASLRPVLHGGATASLALAIPNSPQLAGMVVGCQALVLDVAAPSGLGATTNALLVRAR